VAATEVVPAPSRPALGDEPGRSLPSSSSFVDTAPSAATGPSTIELPRPAGAPADDPPIEGIVPGPLAGTGHAPQDPTRAGETVGPADDRALPAERAGRASGGGRLLRLIAGRVGQLVRARPWLLTAALCALSLGLGLTGPDTPAQEYRVWLFEHGGARLWDDQWYGGHTIPGYSVLFPPLGALFGAQLLAALSCVASTVLVARLLRGPRARRGHDLPVIWFAVVTVADLIVGRGPFALGLAFGALAVVGVRERRWWVALAGAVCSSLASPLAGAFVLLVGVALIGSLSWRRIWPLVGAICGILVSLIFPEEGTQPFPALTYLSLLTLIVAGLLVVPRRERAVRRGLLLWAMAATVFFVLPTTVGGNITRPATLLAGPMAAVLLSKRPKILLIVAVPLIGWSIGPVQGALATQGDPSAASSYYSGMLDYLDRGGPVPVGRVEVPFTQAHWEARYVAPKVPMARGWLRQLDSKYNSLFYDGTLNAKTYHDWLLARGVTYVALPDVPLDPSAQAEAALLRSGLPYLQLGWSNAHWKIWIVTDASGLVQGPAQLTELGVSSMAVNFDKPGLATVLVHYTSFWSITEGNACVFKAAGNWTGILASEAGPVRLGTHLSVDGLTHASELDCPTDQRVH
jgi:hypothetical protein